jgi:hypothetical protein
MMEGPSGLMNCDAMDLRGTEDWNTLIDCTNELETCKTIEGLAGSSCIASRLISIYCY